MRTIDNFLWFRSWIVKLRRPVVRCLYGIDIPPTSSVSLSVRFYPAAEGPIVIDDDTLIAFKTLILGEDIITGRQAPVHIGRRCFIGGGSIIMPGVTIGDGSIVGAGSVVYDDVPPACIVAGNPARILKTGISAGKKGRLPEADERARAAKRRAAEKTQALRQ